MRGETRFARGPLRVYWELTRACGLTCRHCRAEAIPTRDPHELDTAEGRRLLEVLRGDGSPGPHVILTGGDPLQRPDFWELLHHGTSLGLDMSVAPSGTAALTESTIRRLGQSGTKAMSLSLDGSDAARHDGFRGVAGCFDATVEAARAVVAEGIPLQINTLVTAETVGDLPAISDLVGRLGAARWSLFFLIQVGRGRVLGQLSPAAGEKLLGWLWEQSRTAPFTITTTEAPHYRRVALQRAQAAARETTEPERTPDRRGFGIRDGNGIMFVSHRGDIQPSGFLPLVAGNVRSANPVHVYRDAALFQQLREPERFEGRCGRCEFRGICGGSRARAYAASGSPFAEDPLCAYEPGLHRGRASIETA